MQSDATNYQSYTDNFGRAGKLSQYDDPDYWYCFILKVHLPSIEQLDRILDSFLLHGSTTTSIVQSSPVPLRPLPIPGQ